MNCSVCQILCSGQHYKVPSCRACAGFFRRTVQMKLRYRCKNVGNCTITKETRFCCRFCRMQKCIAVGMAMEDEPRISPSFHLDTSDSISAPIKDVQLPNMEELDWFTSEAIFNNNEEFTAFMKNKCVRIFSKPYTPSQAFSWNVCQQSASAYKLHEAKWPEVKVSELRLLNVQKMEQFIVTYCKEMIHIADFLMEIEPFTKLSFRDKALIYPRYELHFFYINRLEVSVKHLGNDPDSSMSITLDGCVFDYKNSKFDVSSICNIPEDQFTQLLVSSETQFENLFAKNFKKILPDDFEIQYLLMRSLWSLQGVEGISEEAMVIADEVLSRLDDEIAYYYKHEKKMTNVASRIYKLHNLLTALERVAEGRMEDKQMWRTFDIFKLDVFIDDLGV